MMTTRKKQTKQEGFRGLLAKLAEQRDSSGGFWGTLKRKSPVLGMHARPSFRKPPSS